jgi:hypothetical protein
VEIGNLPGLGRKQVARVVAEAKPAEEDPAKEEGPPPIACPRRVTPEETFRGKTSDTACTSVPGVAVE